LADNGFLISLFIVNMSNFNLDMFNQYEFVCKYIVYSTNIFSFLSVW
jgi:hypothetical protein